MHASAFVLALCLGSGLAGATAGASPAQAADEQTAYGPELEGFDYPWPVSYYSFTSQGEKLRMAYMDVKPAGTPNGKTVVLFHGKNFCAATWQGTIAALTAAGYRVIAVRIRSASANRASPHIISSAFSSLPATPTRCSLRSASARVIIIGHSMGGMLGMRYALTFPDDVEQLVLVNPIGLEDWKAKGVPWQSIDGWYQQELKTTADSIRDYQRATYYAGTWDARYEPWVQMLAGLYRGPGHDIVAWNAALTDDMAYTQPVFYRARENLRAGLALDRRQGHDCDRQASRFAGGARDARPLSGSGEGSRRTFSACAARRVSRFRPRAADPGAGCLSQGAAGRIAEIATARRRRARKISADAGECDPSRRRPRR